MFVQTTSGVILEVDVPADGTNARELLDYQLATANLVEVTDPVEQIDVPGGGYHWRRIPATVDETPAKPGRKTKAKTTDPDTDVPATVDETPDGDGELDGQDDDV